MNSIRLTSLQRRIKSQRGFTLIEVLIAIVVLAIGLLGLAGLQASSLKNNTSAYTRSQAQLLAYDMLDRLRANREGVINGSYDDLLSSTPSDPNCITSGCSVSTAPPRMSSSGRVQRS